MLFTIHGPPWSYAFGQPSCFISTICQAQSNTLGIQSSTKQIQVPTFMKFLFYRGQTDKEMGEVKLDKFGSVPRGSENNGEQESRGGGPRR